jgi:hypothetical protein
MYLKMMIVVALIAIGVVVTMRCPLPGTSKFSYGTVREGMISKPSFDSLYPFARATHPPTDFAVMKHAEIDMENARLSEKINKYGTRETHHLSNGAICIDPLTGYDTPCTHAPHNVCSIN